MINPGQCPICQSSSGVYTRSIVIQTYFTSFDGEPVESETSAVKGGDRNTVYCAECHTAIGKMSSGGGEFEFSLYKKYSKSEGE